jgi:hypothetical protein
MFHVEQQWPEHWDDHLDASSTPSAHFDLPLPRAYRTNSFTVVLRYTLKRVTIGLFLATPLRSRAHLSSMELGRFLFQGCAGSFGTPSVGNGCFT